MATVAEVLLETLILSDVKSVYGLPGDSLNGFTNSISKHKQVEWIYVRHEEAAAFAAGAEAHLTNRLAVCAGSCGPGNLHFINGLFDCHRSRVPVLAIASQVPSTELGTTYFQETYLLTAFKVKPTLFINTRAEWFSDPHGARNEKPGTYSEATLGLNFMPVNWINFRPEVRGDFAGQRSYAPSLGGPPRRNQLTVAFDVIVKFDVFR
jgi:hypothetical protein